MTSASTSSALVHRVDLRELAVLEPKVWRHDLEEKLRAGSRLVTLYGRRVDDCVTITSVVRTPDGPLVVTRASVAADTGYHALTTDWPSLHCFERELHEQTGVRLAGHPWLKPIRYEGRDQSAMNAHPYYAIDGKEVHEVAVGPIHAGVIEPGSFRFMCLGEEVHHLEIQLGYQHRGVERRLLEGDPRRLTPLVETIAGDSSIAHAWAYCAALESLAGCELDLETDIARAVALELERVAMHLVGLSGLSSDIAYLQGASTYGRLRTTAINTTMRLCGSRFGRGALRPGGIAMSLTLELSKIVQANLELICTDVAIMNDCFSNSRTVQHRLRLAGVLTGAQATELGVVGMIARASGLPIDVRQGPTQGAYRELPLPIAVASTGDCWARAEIRIAEIDASLDWLKAALARVPSWEPRRETVGSLASEQLVVAIVEGWRGEVVHCLETGPIGELVHYKVQDPSLRNWMGLAIAVRNNEISDFPICNKSFDLSYCGNDL